MGDLRNLKNNVDVTCITDTGPQTSGPEILSKLNIPKTYLIPTSHRIMGVTQSFMDIIGVIMVKITV